MYVCFCERECRGVSVCGHLMTMMTMIMSSSQHIMCNARSGLQNGLCRWSIDNCKLRYVHTHTGTRIHRHIRTLVHLTKTESTAASNASAQLRRQRERQRQRQRQRRRRRWSQNFPGQHYFRIVQIHLDEHQLAIGLDVRRPSQSQAKPTKPTKPTNSTKPAKPSDQTTQQPIDQPAK